MPSRMRLMLLCATSMALLGIAGSAMADPGPAGDEANAQGAIGKAPAGESNVRPAPRPQFDRPAGCPYRDGKLELIV